jgi:hypothetical protein
MEERETERKTNGLHFFLSLCASKKIEKAEAKENFFKMWMNDELCFNLTK